MRLHRKSIAVTSAMFLSLSLLTVTTESAWAASNQVSVLSGQGGAGDFSTPRGISVAPNGDVYIADSNSFAIKRIPKNGIGYSVFAKTTIREDGWTDESFCGVYAKTSEEIWASNCNITKLFRYLNGNLVREIKVTRPFNSVAGYDWGGGLVVDNLGGIFLSDEQNHVILRVDEASGQTTVYAGQPGITGNDDVGKGKLSLPRGLALDSKNNLFIADTWNNAIRKVTPDGKISTIAGGLNGVVQVAIDSSDSVYAATENWQGSIITKIGIGRIYDASVKNLDTKLVGSIIGQPALNPLSGFAIDSRSASPTNNLYFTDGINHSIQVYSPSGTFIKKFGSEDSFGVTAPGTLNQIYMWPHQTFPLRDGTYLIKDDYTLRHVSSSGMVLKVTRLERTCAGSNGSAFTPNGTFFCAYGNYIEVRFTDGTWTRIGNATSGKVDGNADTARFKGPEGMAVFQGSLYVADIGNGQIRKIVQSGNSKNFEVTTILGTGVWAGGGDVMPRAKANFASPTRIAIDQSGNLYIADGGVDSIYRTSVVTDTDVTRVGRGLGSWPSSLVAAADGTIFVSGWGGKIFKVENNKMSYFAGGGIGNRLGTTDAALFNRPTGLSIDPKGNLIVADRDNQQIKKIAIDSRPNTSTDWIQSVYSSYLSFTTTEATGLTEKDDLEITERLTEENRTGLIVRVYQGENISTPEKDLSALTLCSVGIIKTMSIQSISNLPLFESSKCKGKRSLISFKGFITWPGSGEQIRKMTFNSQGGLFFKISGKTLIEKWDGDAIRNSAPFSHSVNVDLDGGEQYPIEVLYYGSSSLKTLWLNAPKNPNSIEVIPEKYFSPAQFDDGDVVLAPARPSQPTVSINLNFINLKVRVPVNASSVILFAPEFGFTKAKPLVGKIKDGLASFEVAMSSKFAGQKGVLQLVTENAVGESQPLKIPVTLPKIVKKPIPKPSLLPKPQAPPTQSRVICEKGAQKREFGESCPPGWTNG